MGKHFWESSLFFLTANHNLMRFAVVIVKLLKDACNRFVCQGHSWLCIKAIVNVLYNSARTYNRVRSQRWIASGPLMNVGEGSRQQRFATLEQELALRSGCMNYLRSPGTCKSYLIRVDDNGFGHRERATPHSVCWALSAHWINDSELERAMGIRLVN